MLFYLPSSTSFFCVFQSSKVSSFSSCILLLLWYFSGCIRSILFLFQKCQLLRQCLLGRTHHCLDLCHCSDLSPLQFLGQSRTFFFFFVLFRLLRCFVRCFFFFDLYFLLFVQGGEASLRRSIASWISLFVDSGMGLN